MPYSVRCRYCSHLLLHTTGQLGAREAVVIRTHLATSHANVSPLPNTIGGLLNHVSVVVTLAPAGAKPRDAVLEPPPSEGRHVLIVTADAAVATLGAKTAVRGPAVVAARDAVDALRTLHDVGVPQAVVLDPRLPRAGAFVLASWLAGEARYASIPRYVISRPSDAPADVHTAFAGARIDDAALRALLEGRSVSP